MSDSRPAVPAAVATVFRHELDSGERAALLSWTAFTATFAAGADAVGEASNGREGRGKRRPTEQGGPLPRIELVPENRGDGGWDRRAGVAQPGPLSRAGSRTFRP